MIITILHPTAASKVMISHDPTRAAFSIINRPKANDMKIWWVEGGKGWGVMGVVVVVVVVVVVGRSGGRNGGSGSGGGGGSSGGGRSDGDGDGDGDGDNDGDG